MQASLEAEARGKAEAMRMKKKLEQDMNELESALDSANRGRADADKTIKKLQQQMREQQQQVATVTPADDRLHRHVRSESRASKGTPPRRHGNPRGTHLKVVAPVRYEVPEKKFFWSCPSTVLTLKGQLVVLVSAFVTVSIVWSVSCLLFFHSRCLRAQPFVKWGHVPPVPYGVGATEDKNKKVGGDKIYLMFMSKMI